MNDPYEEPLVVPLLLNVQQAAEVLGIARTSMFKLIGSGEVESVQIGRLRRVPMACLEEYVDRLRQAPAISDES